MNGAIPALAVAVTVPFALQVEGWEVALTVSAKREAVNSKHIHKIKHDFILKFHKVVSIEG
jgi:hypothetical protein